MFNWAIAFFIFALIAGIFGFGGLAGDAAGVAKVLAAIGIVLFIVSLLFGRRSTGSPI